MTPLHRLSDILASYGVRPIKTEKISERMMRIYDLERVYALKRSDLTDETVRLWVHVYKMAKDHQLRSIIPVYVTMNGSLYQKVNGTIYYLTPWKETTVRKQQKHMKQVYKALGTIHAQTKFKRTISPKVTVTQFEAYQTNCETLFHRLESYVEQFELNTYMSPFEWLVCSHYHQLKHMLDMSLQSVDLLIDHFHSTNKWNICLCHGQLDLSHLIFSERVYLINWDHATYQNSIVDLSVFLKQIATDVYAQRETHMEAFEAYLQENMLNQSELHLLVVYLLDLHTYISLVERYNQQTSNNHSQVKQVMALEKHFRQLTFCFSFLEELLHMFDAESIDSTAD